MADTRNQPGKPGERPGQTERQREEQGGGIEDPNRRAGQNPRRGQEEIRRPRTDESEQDTGTTEENVENDPGRQNAG